ncbi:unnamed protein product, partial [Prorocentrum cordatum]
LEMWRAFQNSLLMLTCVVFVEFMALCDAAPRAVQEEGVVRRKGRRARGCGGRSELVPRNSTGKKRPAVKLDVPWPNLSRGGRLKSEKSERERERQAEDEACLRATRAHGGGTGSPLWPAVSRRLAAGGTHHGWSASGARRQLPTTCTRDRPRGARAPRKLAC